MAFNIKDTYELSKAMMTSKSKKIQEYLEEMRVLQLQSSLRNTALLQRLKNLEEKVKESSLKTERLKLLREETRKEAQEAVLSSKPPIPRKESQVFPVPLTSTPYRAQAIRRGPDGINLGTFQPNQRATAYVDIPPKPGHPANVGTVHPNYSRTMNTFSNLRTDRNFLKKLTKTTKSSPIQDYNVHHSSTLWPNPKIQRRAENSFRSFKMSSDFGITPGCSSYKPNSQQREDFSEISEEISIEELTSDDEELSEEKYSLDKMRDDSPNDAKMLAKNGITEGAKMKFKMAAKAESAIDEQIMTKSKLSDNTEIPPKVGFLENANLITEQENPSKEAASIDTQDEIHNGRWPNAKTLTISNPSTKAETIPTKIGNELPAEIAEGEILTSLSVPLAEEIAVNAKNEENCEIQRSTVVSVEKKNSIRHERAPIEDVSEIHEITSTMEILSTSEKLAEIREELDNPNPTESKNLPEFEHLIEPGIENNEEAKLSASNASVNEVNLENEIVSEITTEPADTLTKMPEYDKPEIATNQQPSKIVKNFEKETAIEIIQEKTTGGILSFMSSDEDDDDDDDDDEEDSFFDSIPKPHAPVVQERMLESQFILNSTIKPEEISDPLSDDAGSDIDHQLATLVTSTAPKRFVEHEMAQSEQDLQKEENTPSKTTQKDKTIKNTNSERSTESGLTSQPLPVPAEKQPNQKLHQKLAMHLGLDSTTNFRTSEAELKKDKKPVEEDDFDFYD